MRKLLLAAAAVAALASSGRSAHAEVGLGVFFGAPSGLDLKIDASPRSSIDIVLGWSTFRDGRDHYGHITYLVTPFVGQGNSVVVPLRIGIGAAIYDDGSFDAGINAAVRVPLELALKLRSAPVEFYGEIALECTVIDANNNNDLFDAQGGIGFRAYF